MRRALFLALLIVPTAAGAESITFEDALRAAHQTSPDLRVARGRERATEPLVRAAKLYPNPTGSIGTSTEGPYLGVTVSVPIIVLGQIGTGVSAARAEQETA